MTPMVVFVVAMAVAGWAFYRSQDADQRGWARYQATGVGALLVAGVVGTVLQPGLLRFLWLAMVVVAAVRLTVLPKQSRNRAARLRVSSGPSE